MTVNGSQTLVAPQPFSKIYETKMESGRRAVQPLWALHRFRAKRFHLESIHNYFIIYSYSVASNRKANVNLVENHVSAGLQRASPFFSFLLRFVLLLMTVRLVLFLLLPALYAHATVDDFCFAKVVRDHGSVGGTWHWYLTHTGRLIPTLITMFAIQLSLVEMNTTWMGWYVAGIISATWLLLSWVSARSFKMRPAWSLVSGALILYAAYRSTPIQRESWFWPCAVAIYVIPPVLLSSFFFELFRISVFKKVTPRCIYTMFALGLFTSLWNEIVGPIAVVVAGSFFFATTARKAPRIARQALLSGLIGATLGVVVLVVSPGNWARAADMANEGFAASWNALFILKGTIQEFLSLNREVFRWRGSFAFLGCFAVGAALARLQIASLATLPPLRWILGYAVSSAFVLSFVPIVVTSTAAPARVYVTLTVIYAVAAFASGVHAGTQDKKELRFLQWTGLAALLILTLGRFERRWETLDQTIAYSYAFADWHERIMDGERDLGKKLPASGFLFRHDSEPSDATWVGVCVRDGLGIAENF